MSTLPLFDDPRAPTPGGKARPPDNGDDEKIYRLSQLNRAVRGLLEAERKRALPHLPRVLGVVTSLHGAALHDIIRVMQARSPTRIRDLALLGPGCEHTLGRARLRVAYGSHRLRDPRQVLRRTRTRLQALEQRLHALMRAHLRAERAQLAHCGTQLTRSDPRQALRDTRTRLKSLEQRLHALMRGRLRAQRAAIAQHKRELANRDPR